MVSQGVRTHTCGELRRSHVGQSVELSGWVNSCREMGGALVFVDLRDKYGITQVAFDDSVQAGLRGRARELKSESTIHVRGVVRPRPAGQENKERIQADHGLSSLQFNRVLHRARKRFQELWMARQSARSRHL